MGRFHIGVTTLPAVTDRAAVFAERMLLQNFRRVRLEWIGRAVQAFPFHPFVTSGAAIDAIQIFHPNLLQSARSLRGPVGAKLLRYHLLKLILITFPFRRVVVPEDKRGND